MPESAHDTLRRYIREFGASKLEDTQEDSNILADIIVLATLPARRLACKNLLELALHVEPELTAIFKDRARVQAVKTLIGGMARLLRVPEEQGSEWFREYILDPSFVDVMEDSCYELQVFTERLKLPHAMPIQLFLVQLRQIQQFCKEQLEEKLLTAETMIAFFVTPFDPELIEDMFPLFLSALEIPRWALVGDGRLRARLKERKTKETNAILWLEAWDVPWVGKGIDWAKGERN